MASAQHWVLERVDRIGEGPMNRYREEVFVERERGQWMGRRWNPKYYNTSTEDLYTIGLYLTHGSSGTAIFAATWPVVRWAALTMPSVPAEYNCAPS